MDSDLIYKIALTQIPGIGSVLAKNLISYCGGAKEVFNKSRYHLQKTPGVGSLLAQNIVAFKDFSVAEKELEFIQDRKIQPIFFLDKEYPFRLKQISDAPIMLYKKGSANLSPERIIAIVGTRKMTDYGRHFIKQLVSDLSESNVTVISGLAYGVDIWTHKQCVENHIKTIGVVAHGLDRLYPSLHSKTATEMIKQEGAIVSEHVSGTKPDRENFPKRNRIVAGMVDAVIVVESAASGGSLITAELANQYNRDVMALPGDIHKEYSKGCNRLIKTHKANVIESFEDLVKLLNWDVKVKRTAQTMLFHDLNLEEQSVVEYLRQHEELGVDQLMAQTGYNSSLLAITLLELEMKNCIASLPGKMYKAI
jgi:DNA processing protein